MAVDRVTQESVEQELRDAVLSTLSIFGRLVAISGFRNEDGKYYHELSWRHGVSAVDTILRDLHREIFASWLLLNLRRQQGDLTHFLKERGEERLSAPALAASCSGLLPEDHTQSERELFLSDLSLVICLVYCNMASTHSHRMTGAKSPARAAQAMCAAQTF